MVDEIREVREERPRETVVVERNSNSGLGAVVGAVLLVLFLLFVFFVWRPFSGNGATDIDVNVPTPNVNVTPSEGTGESAAPQQGSPDTTQ